MTNSTVHSAMSAVRFARTLSLLVALPLTVHVGCGPSANTATKDAGYKTAEQPSTDAAPTGLKVLQDMAAAYKKTPTYADSGDVTLRVKIKGGQPTEQKYDFSVSLARPNRIRLHAYQSAVVSDGKTAHATMLECPGYVLTYEAPAELTLDNVYTDPMLKESMENQVAGGLPQMAFLLGEEPLRMVLPEKDPPELLSPQKIGDALCHRVALKHNDGLLVFWIDQRTNALLRIEYPVDTMRKNFTASSGEVEELSLVAEFTGAQLGGKIDEVAFRFEAPAGSKEIKRFVGPPPPETYKQLGQKAKDFTFTRPDGSPVSPQSLAGKVAVIDFWATWAGPCSESLPKLMQVYEKYKGNDRVEFVAVSVDVPEVTNAQLDAKLAEFKVQLPIARDPQQFARTAFGVEGVPNLFIIGPDGKLQENEMGGNPLLVTELPRKLDKLLAGQDIWQESIARYETLIRDYEASMMQEPPAATAESTGPPPVAIAQRSEPATFELKELWSVRQPDLTAPGNVQVIENANQEPKLLVNDGWRTVVEIDAQGKVIAKHDLDLPPNGVVSFIRMAADTQGRRHFAGSASNQQQVHVWDQDWRRVLSFPDSEHAGIADLQMGDLDGDGKPELLVSYWDVVGIQALSLEGQRLWSDRSLANVFRLAIIGPEAGRKQVFAANDKGTIAMFGYDGQKISDLVIPDRFVRLVAAADLDGDGRQEFCGLSPTREPHEVLLGIGSGGEEVWNHPLPAGIHQHPIEAVTHGKLLPGNSGQWLAAAADGSIHVVSSDGKLVDQFNYGAALTGLAVANINGQGVLLVSTPEKLTAWGVTPRGGGR